MNQYDQYTKRMAALWGQHHFIIAPGLGQMNSAQSYSCAGMANTRILSQEEYNYCKSLLEKDRQAFKDIERAEKNAKAIRWLMDNENSHPKT